MFLACLLFLNNFQCLLSGQKKQLTLPAVPGVTCWRQGLDDRFLMAQPMLGVPESQVCKPRHWLDPRLENVVTGRRYKKRVEQRDLHLGSRGPRWRRAPHPHPDSRHHRVSSRGGAQWVLHVSRPQKQTVNPKTGLPGTTNK